MRSSKLVPAMCYGLLLVVEQLSGIAAQADEDASLPLRVITAAVNKSLPLLEKGAKGSMAERKQCFTCHNQAMPIMALTEMKSRGIRIDEDHLRTQLRFVADFLDKNKEKYREGKGQGGQIDTAGYALWTLANGGWKPDETTAAVTEYLLLYQKDAAHWRSQSRRPPSEQSSFTSTYVALRGLQQFGTPEQQERIHARTEQVRQWVLQTQPLDTEDRVFRLRVLKLIAAPEAEIKSSVTELLDMQNSNGGWGQLIDMESDAYATGSVLVALHDGGNISTDDLAFQRGLTYLISSQQEDGSWHVVSRSKPFQTYFESGYPHGTDQFISIAAAGWATTALALTIPATTAAGE